ncbi:BON domain-containing protein [Chitinimonas koreensis]|uniref:BON domain-containing protein n=1 Tax=Chitinimonas koreensis TaxID=356302 RepID=UPI00041F20DE|nr:BON domain-containing protein [Chitinimonas koreensis]QNM97425.1 BON domain-containing protein [Chitinimonas koreensis]
MQNRLIAHLVATAAFAAALATPGFADSTVANTADKVVDKVAATTEKAADKVAAGTEKAAASTKEAAAKAGQYLDDATVTAKVKAALVADKTVSALDVKVITNQGVVTLTGHVDRPEVGERALQLASTVEGVKGVKSELVVKTQ